MSENPLIDWSSTGDEPDDRRDYLIRVVNELLKFNSTGEQIVQALEMKGVTFNG